jgi:hypothetical protein
MKIKYLIALYIFLAFASGIFAQTMSPAVAEYGKKANGSFKLQNNTLQPVAVVIEPFSFSVDKDGQHFRKLDATVHLDLSQTSARLGPKEIHEFSYKVKCDVLPCTFSLLTGMIIGHTQDGLAVRVILPHVVYICEKQKDCRAGVLRAAGL